VSKITPQDYINAKPELARAGYLAIKAKAKNTSVADIAKLYGVSADVIDLIKLSGNVEEFETIVRLESERQLHEAEKEAEQSRSLYNPDPVPVRRVSPVANVIAIIIVIGVIVGIGWGVVQIANFIGGLF
jgi:hypothetical protein